MKTTLLKTIFFTVFYFGIFYVFLFIAFVLEEVMATFHPEDALDNVNYVLIFILLLMSFILSIIFFCISLSFPYQYIKSLKDRGNY